MLFFEDLIDDPKKVCQEVLEWLNMDSSALEKIVFRPVNQAHHARSKTLRKIALKTNMRFQHFFRRNEGVKRLLVKVYHAVNARKKKQSTGPTDEQRTLNQLYSEENRNLRKLLISKGYTHFPAWLEEIQ